MTLLQKILLCIYIFLTAAGQLGWFGTNPFWIGIFGIAFVIAVVVEDVLVHYTVKQ